MAIDAQVLNLIREQGKRQSKYRQVSRDYMRDTNRSINSLDSNIRYNIEQSNALRSGLGDFTGKILSQIKASSKETIQSTTNSRNLNNSEGDIGNIKNSPLIDKLEQIRNINEEQKNIVQKYIDSKSRTNSYEDETNKDLDARRENNLGVNAELLKRLKDIQDQSKDEDTKDKKSSWITTLLKSAVIPTIAGLGLAIVAEPLYRIKNTFQGLPSVIKGAFGAAKSAWDGSINALKGVKNFFLPAADAAADAAKAAKTAVDTAKTIKTVDTAMDVARTADVATDTAKAIKTADAALDATKAASSAASTIKTIDAAADATKAASTAAGATKTFGSVLKALPGVAGASKALGVANKAAPWVTLAMEGYETAKLLTMDSKERQKMLEDETKAFTEKSPLNQLWYSYTNQAKTIAMAMQTSADISRTYEDIKLIEEANLQQELILKRKRAQKEKENTPEARQQKLEEMGDLNKLNFADFESTRDLQSYLTTAEGRKYYEQLALEQGISKKEARAQIMEQYNENPDGSIGGSPERLQIQENVEPAKTIESALDKNTQTFETLAADLKEYMANSSNNVVMSTSTNITAPGVDYGERQRQMIAG